MPDEIFTYHYTRTSSCRYLAFYFIALQHSLCRNKGYTLLRIEKVKKKFDFLVELEEMNK